MDFEKNYHDFLLINADQIKKKQQLKQSFYYLSHFAEKLRRDGVAKKQMDDFLAAALIYSELLAKETCRKWVDK